MRRSGKSQGILTWGGGRVFIVVGLSRFCAESARRQNVCAPALQDIQASRAAFCSFPRAGTPWKPRTCSNGRRLIVTSVRYFSTARIVSVSGTSLSPKAANTRVRPRNEAGTANCGQRRVVQGAGVCVVHSVNLAQQVLLHHCTGAGCWSVVKQVQNGPCYGQEDTDALTTAWL